MKLFFQLNSKEQDIAVEYCADFVLKNTIENGLNIEINEDPENFELKNKIDDLLARLKKDKTLTTFQEKIDFLMAEEFFVETIYDLSTELANNAYYHENDELVIYTDSLESSDQSPESNEEDQDDKKSLLN